MRVRRLSATGDYTFGQGAANFFVDQALGVGQKVGTRLKLFEGEWFLDQNDGTPWNQDVFGVRSNPTYDLAIQAQILMTPGVQSLVSYSSTLTPNVIENGVPARRLSVVADILTIYSAQPVTVEVNL